MSATLPLISDPAIEIAGLTAQLYMARQRDRQAREMFAPLAGLPTDRSLEEMFHRIRVRLAALPSASTG